MVNCHPLCAGFNVVGNDIVVFTGSPDPRSLFLEDSDGPAKLSSRVYPYVNVVVTFY